MKTCSKPAILASIIGAFLMFSASSNADELKTLTQLQQIDQSSVVKDTLDSLISQDGDDAMRLRAMRDAALGLGAQHGYATELRDLKHAITSQSHSMDAIFDFNSLMKVAGNSETEEYLLPAVLKEATNVTSVSPDHKEVTVAGNIYEIEKPERLVSRAPNWRDYLIYDEDLDLSIPNKSLLPSSDKEKAAWDQWVKKGWVAGVKQADMEMTYRVRRLGGDYIGMVKYLRFVSLGKITRPEIVATAQNVIGGGSKMSVQNETYNLVTQGKLVSNEKDWKPVIMDARGSLETWQG